MKSVTQANNLQKEPKREIVCDDKMNLRRDESESFAELGSEPVIISRKRMIGPGLKTEQNLNRLEATWRPQAQSRVSSLLCAAGLSAQNGPSAVIPTFHLIVRW